MWLIGIGTWQLTKSTYVELKRSDADARCRPGTSQADKVTTPDVTGEQRSSHL